LHVLLTNLEDDTLAWRLDQDGDWWRLADETPEHEVDTHLRLHEYWAARAHPVR
jgi:hypothetical protein